MINLQEIWEDKTYIKRNREDSEKIFWSNPGLVKLYWQTRTGRRILDAGCGDGRILELVYRPEAKWWGVDVSSRGVGSAKKRFSRMKNISISLQDISQLKFPQRYFDIVYSSYVLEHVDNYQAMIQQLDRVLKPGGKLIIVCPNYGSPLEYAPNSPNQKRNLKVRAIGQFVRSWKWLVINSPVLVFQTVMPKALAQGHWEQDWDVVNEPYVMPLNGLLKTKRYRISEIWTGIERVNNFDRNIWGLFKRICVILGTWGWPPFKYFGPTLYICATKR